MSKIKERLRKKVEQRNKDQPNYKPKLNADQENEECKNFLKERKYIEAVEAGERALDLVPKEAYKLPHLIAPLWYNLGLAYEKVDINKALKFYEKAEPHFKGDDKVNIHYRQVLSYSQKSDFEQADKIAKNVPGSIGQFLRLQVKLSSRNITLDEAEKERVLIKTQTDDEKKESLTIKAAIEALQGNVPGLMESMTGIEKNYSVHQITFEVYKALNTLRIAGKFTEAAEFLDLAKKQFSIIEGMVSPNIIFNLFMINEQNDNYDTATTYFLKLQELSKISSVARTAFQEANEQRLCTEIYNGNYKKAREVLKNVNCGQDWYLKVINKLEKEDLEEAESTKKTNSSKLIKTELSNAIIEADLNNSKVDEDFTKKLSKTTLSDEKKEDVNTATVDEEFNLDDFDAKKIHAYFKNKKALLARKKVEEADDGLKSWILPNGTKYDTNSKENIYKIDGRDHYYICIKNNLKLGSEFIKAMKKGVVSKSYSSTGIKFFKNSDSVECVELKINGGNRAWSKNMYVNPEGDYLVMIDGYGNHLAAGKAAQEGIKITSVSSHLSHRSIASDVSSDDLEYHHHTTFSEHKDYYDHHDDVDLAGDTSIA